MICSVMFGNGAMTGTGITQSSHRSIRWVPRMARTGWAGAVAGATVRPIAARRTAAGTLRASGAASWAFVWPQFLPLQASKPSERSREWRPVVGTAVACRRRCRNGRRSGGSEFQKFDQTSDIRSANKGESFVKDVKRCNRCKRGAPAQSGVKFPACSAS